MAKKKFIVFNGRPPNTIEHSKTVFRPNVLSFFFLSKYVLFYIFFYHFKIFLTKCSWFGQLRLFCTARHLKMFDTRNLFLMKIQKQGFQTAPQIEKISAHTDVFQKILGPDCLCGGLIHLNVEVNCLYMLVNLPGATCRCSLYFLLTGKLDMSNMQL